MSKTLVKFSVIFLLSLLFIGFSSEKVFAQPLLSTIQQPRTLAMGGAGVGLADDEYALFQNPAGLAGSEKRSFRLLGLSLEGSSDVYTVFGSSISAVKNFNTSSLNVLMGKNIFFRGGATPLIQLPHFSIAYIVDAQGSLSEFNRANPYFTLGDQITHGVQAGMGWSFKNGKRPVDEWRVGFAEKILWRRGGYYNISTDGFLQAKTQGKSYLDNLTGTYGMGFGTDVGMQYIYHIDKITDVMFGASVTDIGDTKFSDTHASPILMNESFGLGFKKKLPFFSLAFDADMRNLNADVAGLGKTHFGVDVGIPLFDLMAGLNQGYVTYGVAFDLWIMRLSLLSYGQELGVDFRQIPSRNYLFQIDFKLPI